MTKTPHALQLSSSASDTQRSPAQKRFATLTRQIETARKTLTDWQHALPAYRRSFADVLEPLRTELRDGMRQWVFALDAALADKSWTKTERSTLADLLCSTVDSLLGGGGDDPELKALYTKHAGVDFDEEQRLLMDEVKELAEQMTGLDLGDDGVQSQDDLLSRLQASFEAAQAEEDARRKPARRPARSEALAQQATQSLREIYRKLVSALHPDRETDPAQREAKTAQMQRVNQAYEAKDLLTLLQLQVQIEQIDADHLATASEQRVKHYNQVLADQLAELKAEIERVELGFCLEFALPPDAKVTPKTLGKLLEHTRREWLLDRVDQKNDLARLNDKAATKRWLKEMRQAQRAAQDLDFRLF